MPGACQIVEQPGALQDRVDNVQSTLWHTPYYQRHLIRSARVTGMDGAAILAETNCLVIRTKRDLRGQVFSAGRYVDRIVNTIQGLRFEENIASSTAN